MGCSHLGLLERLGFWWCLLTMANICCSIELEPKTLNQGQLNIAREVAADIALHKDSKESTIIHIQGLEQVKEEKNVVGQVIEGPCQCSVVTIYAESPDQSKLKEPLSAPF